MARTTFGITTTAITWEKTKSEISVNETGMAEISVEGAVNSTGIGLEAALDLVPSTLPSSFSGPLGATSKYSGAKISTKSASYEDGTWQVRATYNKGGALTFNFDEDETQRADEDRYERRIVVSEEPIMTHPVAMLFPIKEKNKLANLLSGNTEPNIDYDPDDEDANPEFVTIDASTGEMNVKVQFSNEEVTSDGVTASPLDYARLIKAGIITYQRKTVRHSRSVSRNNPATNSDYKQVGTIVSSPPGAPNLASGYQWMLTGIIDTSSNNESWSTSYEYEASGAGGFLGVIYKGGNQTTDPE
jgi:hypothetical protein